MGVRDLIKSGKLKPVKPKGRVRKKAVRKGVRKPVRRRGGY